MNILEKIKKFYKDYKVYIKSFIIILIYVIVSFTLYFVDTKLYDKYSIYTNILFTVGGLILFTHILLKHYNLALDGADIQNGNKMQFKMIYKKMFIFTGLLIALVLIAYSLIYLTTNSKTFTEIMTLLFNIAGVFLVLFLSYLLIEKVPFFRKIKNLLYKSQITTIIYHSIFYLPCLFNNIIEYIKNLETETIPNYVYYILGGEFIFVFAYLFIPKIKQMIMTYGGKQLLDTPIYLDKEVIHSTYEELNGAITGDNKFNYNYSLSFWIFIHNSNGPNHTNTGEYISILNYGNKPNILYNQQDNKLKFILETNTDKHETIYEFNNLPLQKWNNIVINYDSGLFDIFINKKLVSTEKTTIPYMSLDSIISGTTKGISGGIKNIMYYKNPITKSKIDFLYDNSSL